MAKSSTVSPTVEPNIPRGDKDEDKYEEEDWVVSLRNKGESVFKVLCKDKIACSHFFEILTTAIESQKLIWMHENTIDKKGALEREYANDVASLKNDLEEEQETVASLEEQLETLEVSQNEIVSKLTKERDHAKAQVKMLKKENSKVGVGHDKLVKDLDDLDKAHKALESEHSILTKSHEQLQASYLKEHAMLPTLLNMSCDDACATNSTSCEASILKENVELRAQLELLTCNYGKLEENHGKLSRSHEDLLASHDRLKLAHETIISKATPCEPHVDTSTSTQNAILPCASPCNSSTHNIAKSCDELSSLPCCSNNEDSTSSSTCVVTNHVEEIKELKAQVTSLKNDLVKGHEGKCKLDTMLSMQQSPNDKSGLGFKSNNKNKSKNNNKKKGQVRVKDPAKIVCFKCNIEGHHVRSCPLKKKQKGSGLKLKLIFNLKLKKCHFPRRNKPMLPLWRNLCSRICEDAPKKKLSHDGLWGSNPQDFVKQAQSRKAFHLVAVKTIIIKLKWNAQEMASPINFNQFLEKEKLKSNGSNFTDWFRHVRIFLSGGNLQFVLDAPLGDPPAEDESDEVKAVYATRKTRYSQVQCAILCSLESDLQKRFEHHDPHELMNELKAIFETHAAVECYEASKHFFSCMMEEGSSVSEHMLAMTGHAKKL
ncbi:hypothetical protein QYE76_006255 [Lolium multiflorum]|uniref:CCHC-type domain-containing protein n=1 Tax=Lolium multiflorum TaxID=4521 RepID=A0AAD8RUJ3_LOLMU|nr:hypothetical protein QYE76_006255 [Lolium multiflorum]